MPVVLINAFEVSSGQEEVFLSGWASVAERLKAKEGFVSADLHRSLDPNADFRFINVAIWRSAKEFREAIASLGPDLLPFRAHPALYEVVRSIS